MIAHDSDSDDVPLQIPDRTTASEGLAVEFSAAGREHRTMRPLHIVSFDLLRKGRAPAAWQNLAAQHGVRAVWLVDDRQLQSSYHHPAEHTIYVNTRGATWYQTARDFGVQTYAEAVTLWFLHELGHAVHGHQGADPKARALRFGNDDRREVQAWHFALSLRETNPSRWNELVEAYAGWYAGYRHRRKNWPDSLDEALAAGWPRVAYRAWPALIAEPPNTEPLGEAGNGSRSG